MNLTYYMNVCNNCNKYGHMFHNCKYPIMSYGIILFRKNNGINEFLMIRRKDSFGYIDFIRGKYSPYNIEQIQSIVNEMSLYEKERILTIMFNELWQFMWGNGSNSNNQYLNEEIMSSKKFELIKSGLIVDENVVTLQHIVQNSNTCWTETEWEFPKGRRNNREKDLECALREFQEETGISCESILIIQNILPFEETFIGTNHKSYKHKYFLAYTTEINNELLNYQQTEVSKIEWKTYEQCLENIRPYNLEKKQLISNINKLLNEYTLY
jgi:8-oxo-dGTP pyrophosphatase MutT (NUDIX family)